MTDYKIQNNVYTTLTSSISDSDDIITVNVASAPFNSPPDLSSGETGILTIVDSTKDPTKIEVINYLNWANNGDGTITISGCTRGQDGTTAYSFASGAVVMQSITNGVLSNVLESAGASIDNLSDVSTSGVSDNDFFIYNSSTGTWEPSNFGIDYLSDVDTSGVSNENALIYNTSTATWSPSALNFSKVSEISDLSDVDTSGVTNDDFLVYNASTGTWEASAVGLGNAAYRDYYISTSDPTSGDGNDGDVWYKVT